MSDKWEAGDLALCIKSLPITSPARPKPRAGQIFTVRSYSVEFFKFKGRSFDTGALWFVDAPMNYRGDGYCDRVWPADCFVKIPPLSEEDENEFFEDLRLDIRELI